MKQNSVILCLLLLTSMHLHAMESDRQLGEPAFPYGAQEPTGLECDLFAPENQGFWLDSPRADFPDGSFLLGDPFCGAELAAACQPGSAPLAQGPLMPTSMLPGAEQPPEAMEMDAGPSAPEAQGPVTTAVAATLAIGNQDHPIYKFHCEHCTEKYISSECLKNHIKKAHADKIHQCPKCNKRFFIESDWEKHQGRCHFLNRGPVGRFHCAHTGCGKSFAHHHDLSKHMRTHTAAQIYGQVAPNMSPALPTMPLPVMEVEAGPSAPAVQGCVTTAATVAATPNSQDGSKLMFVCQHCTERFIVASLLHQHIIKKHPETLFPCPHCKMKCQSTVTRDKHIRVCPKNSENKQFLVCPKCPQLPFNFARNLQNHAELKHHGEPIFACRIQGCRAAYKRIVDLKEHMKTHTAVGQAGPSGRPQS